uniref:Putative von Willebrand factor A domain-containing protein n=1 Tax=viral metagenome TaxID=1070528 RepID=A0A6H1ZLE3_9ZZZZ
MTLDKFNIQKSTGPALTSHRLKDGKKLTLRQMQLKTRPQTQRTAILADISGSMNGRKMLELKRCLSTVWSVGIYAIAFSSNIYEMEQSDIAQLKSEGSTNMQGALEVVWKSSASHIILLTDGQPDQSKADILLDVTAHKEIPIDTVGIGDKGRLDYDPIFLAEMSLITGGRFTDCGDPIKLTMVVQNLLEYKPTGISAPVEGVIEL